MKLSHEFSSNAVRLTGRDLLISGGVLAACFVLTPILWNALFPCAPAMEDYRVPYRLSSDYWLVEEWAQRAAERYPCLVLGDSVMWGQYVRRDETLTHYLNEALGKEVFANLGLDGAHPAALDGLICHYGKAIRNKAVILNLNALWMSSPRSDLREPGARFNHPALVPQLPPDRPPCYRPSLSTVMEVAGGRHVPFFSLLNHIRATSYDNLDLKTWTIEHPFDCPLAALHVDAPRPEDGAKEEPRTWQERGITQQDMDWLSADSSYQWKRFQSLVRTLRARDNRVAVLSIPFNTYMLTESSRLRYETLVSSMCQWLAEQNVPVLNAPELPSAEYADGSHPLSEGYRRIATVLVGTQAFREWINEARDLEPLAQTGNERTSR